MKKYILFLIIFILVFFTTTVKAFAASLSFELPTSVLSGDTFEVLINADTDGVTINSIDLKVDYDEELLEFAGYKSNDGVIKLWIASPNEEEGAIHVSGIIPGGVSGLYDPNQKELGEIPLTKLIFTARKNGSAQFSFSETKIFKHDGKGTSLAHDLLNGEVLIKNNKTSVEVDSDKAIFDKEKPEAFQAIFLEAAFFGRTPSMIIFNTSDGGSGVKEYQVNTGGDSWEISESPFPISKRVWSRYVTIRAVDFYGNYQDSVIKVPGLLTPKLLFAIFVFTVFCISVFKVLKYRV